jgi:hypothetical protein
MFFNKNSFSVSCKCNHVALTQKNLPFTWFCAGLAQSVVTEIRHGRRRAWRQISFGGWENSSSQNYQRGCTEVSFPRGESGLLVKMVTRMSLLSRLREGGVITSSYPYIFMVLNLNKPLIISVLRLVYCIKKQFSSCGMYCLMIFI